MSLGRYLSAAFWLRPTVPGLGNVPLNLLGLAGCAALTLYHPAFALIGLACETAYLAWLVSSPRFRRWVDATDSEAQRTVADVDARRQALIDSLQADDRKRQLELDARCARIIRVATANQQSDVIVQDPAPALRRIAWIHLKLLIARHTLSAEMPSDDAHGLQARSEALSKELSDPAMGEAVRKAKQATLDITQRRLENLLRRRTGLAEIDAELTRIDAQLDLALEDAALRESPTALASHLDFATHELDSGSFGVNQSVVADIDRELATVARPTVTVAR